MEYKELLNKASSEMKKVVSFIKENKSMFDYMDLKCHDVSYYCYKDMEKDFPLCYESNNDYFGWFCDEEYDYFLEWCNDNNIDFNKMYHQLGRTSSFYLQDWHDTNIDFMLYNIITEIGYSYSGNYFTLTDGVITSTDYDTYEDATLEDLDYIATEFYNDFMKAIEDIQKVYNYIKDFKENQVEIFKEFLEYYEGEIKSEKEQEEKDRIEKRNKCYEIQAKYDITVEDMRILKENIIYF